MNKKLVARLIKVFCLAKCVAVLGQIRKLRRTDNRASCFKENRKFFLCPRHKPTITILVEQWPFTYSRAVTIEPVRSFNATSIVKTRRTRAEINFVLASSAVETRSAVAVINIVNHNVHV